VSGLDDLIKSAQGGGAAGGGGLGDLIGGVLGGRGATGGSGSPAGGLGGGLLGALLPVVASMLANGGLKKLLAGLQAKGLGAEADSWVSPGANKQVGGAEVRDVLGDDEITRISDKLGIPEDEAAEAVATVLPDVVDQVTPEGKLPADDELDSAFGRLRSLGPAS
jgi:uncharacterized protein YidB (DUF937 family)